jgi:branched-chain amino acid aminotransferase
MNEIIWLNGALMPAEQARISAFDYGFLYGYGLFETMRAYNGRIFRMDRHLERLESSLKKLGIKADVAELEAAVAEVIRANELSDARVRIAVSIGEGKAVPDPASCGSPTVLITAFPYEPFPEEVYERGFRAVLSSIRRNSQSPLPVLKSANYLENLLARQEAKKAGVDEAIFLNDRGFLAEASVSNIFLVKDGELLTPGEESGILPGIVRETIIRLAPRMKINLAERDISIDEMYKSEEAFLTNSIVEIMPLVNVDGRTIGRGIPGEVTLRLISVYKKVVKAMTSGR